MKLKEYIEPYQIFMFTFSEILEYWKGVHPPTNYTFSCRFMHIFLRAPLWSESENFIVSDYLQCEDFGLWSYFMKMMVHPISWNIYFCMRNGMKSGLTLTNWILEKKKTFLSVLPFVTGCRVVNNRKPVRAFFRKS